MKKIEFTVEQTRIKQDRTAMIPDDIYEKGEVAITDYLYSKGHVDDALDYAESNTKIILFDVD